jgi:hypothetical protein
LTLKGIVRVSKRQLLLLCPLLEIQHLHLLRWLQHPLQLREYKTLLSLTVVVIKMPVV